jgi:Ni2+-binding GTPase involved in maturation of urease and hydrogenase
MSTATTRLILVGGFLGAGKTTLLRQAAVRLAGRGRRVALLANDQAADLVDTAVLQETGAAVDEVAGGCFCCRFNDMVAAIDRLKLRAQPDYIIAEPVGSCTDISATVLQPLKQLHGRQIELSLYSVLIDVRQARVLLRLHQEARGGGAGFPDDVLYIYRKQVEEADLIVLNKADLATAADLDELRLALASQFAETPIVTISALTGDGVEKWLDLLARNGPAGGKIAQVDYDTYAAGEAALGWMNASVELSANIAVDWVLLAGQLLERVRASVRQAGGHIGHLKLYLTTRGQGHVAGNITSNDSPVAIRGSLPPDVRQASLLLNARVQIHADRLREIAETTLQSVAAEHGVEAVLSATRSFFPSRPVPTHRFADVVGGEA